MKETRNNDCYIGCRVSTPKQAQYGESLEDQEKAIKVYAHKLNFNIVKNYSEQHTATKSGDSFIDDILIEIRKLPLNKRASFFVIKSIDRFCRAGTTEYSKLKTGLEELDVMLLDVSGIIQPKINTLEHLGVEFPWSVISPSEKNEMMKAQDSKEEVSTILTRMIGAEVSLVQGGYKVRGADDGYENKKVFIENKKKVIQVPDANRAPFFIKMFEMSVTHTDKEVVDFVNAMGYRSRLQKVWSRDKKRVVGSRGGIPLTIKQLQKIRQRPIYCGINTEKWLQSPIKTQYEGLVSITTFNGANKGKVFIEEKKDGSIVIHKDYNPHQLKRMRDNPLFPHKEVVLCPQCAKPFLGSSPTGKSGKSFPVYHCARHHKYFGVSKKEFEKQLTAFITHLKYKDEGFFKSFEATLINKFREKEKELGEVS
ncbi:recombinase family protein, partial [Candidatus Nomurabacteria bacterium]|nr:recombinase family protein [Candidatus Nomurabacteria bacterium]